MRRRNACADFWSVIAAGHHNDLGADIHAAVQVDHVRIQHSDTTARYPLTDCRGRIGTVDAVHGIAEVDRPRAQRVAVAARHPAGQVGLALDHFRRRRPIGPLGLTGHCLFARPSKAVAPYADAVADGLTIAEHVVQKRLRSIDDHGPRRESRWKHNDLSSHLGPGSRVIQGEVTIYYRREQCA